ncbi:nucleoside triphosphate pyrophosphohydrolase [Celerinatantimonas diazotrophica]|uniref:Nucleoside triphosphate pyrophosphohydrolase n=1 Tax=Celerinatantimonas diazotrophica TaxID=412034 RepID=A0A4R1JAS9_9GAMM|nr:nucleoside triphosphate pyrophosphohydrolase [Celerinatantimonas diazotrophica]TCK47199.1 ATP diphosphatase [Celerinatantimonas diazotrophica]CAG9295971.1 Nucleoside triphosphate pyrophosphohydrolase [Celerinatantimonas diazotrophica]
MSVFQPPYTFDTLLEIMARLRDPQQGCPWDLRQSFETLVPHSIEEVYEVAEAVRLSDDDALRLELGDLLFQVVFFAQIAKENQQFDFAAIIDGLCEKLLRRHPHVFGCAQFASEAQVNANWEAEKAKERADKKAQSVLDDVPLALPALSRAQKLQKRAANVGFDWDNAQQVTDKVAEELEEVRVEQQREDSDALAEEIGDLLFASVNLARKHGFDSETLLRKANEKFERRFRQVEQFASDSDKTISEHSLDELENYWIEVKAQEQSH